MPSTLRAAHVRPVPSQPSRGAQVLPFPRRVERQEERAPADPFDAGASLWGAVNKPTGSARTWLSHAQIAALTRGER